MNAGARGGKSVDGSVPIMIVWLASYPRSGNTFLRIVLRHVYGVATYSVYEDDDPVARRKVGTDLVGYRPRPTDRTLMTDGPSVYFVKTHKRRKADGFPAICLVRDGRDAVVSNAQLGHGRNPRLATSRRGSRSCSARRLPVLTSRAGRAPAPGGATS